MTDSIRIVSTLAALCLTGAAALAQGADDCGNAFVISGTGMFMFDNNGATIDGPADCESGVPVRRDVWFRWTAPTSDVYEFATCGQTSLQTRIAIYDSVVCPASNQIACASDNCASGQSKLLFTSVAGSEYLLRVGSRLVGQSGNGTFSLMPSSCGATQDDAFEPNDVCLTNAMTLGDGTYPGLFEFKFDPDWYKIEVPDGNTLQLDILFTHANGDIDTRLFNACGGSVLFASQSGNDNEQIIWTNSTGSCEDVYLTVFHWDNDDSADCNSYDLVVTGSGTCQATPIGTSFCTTSPNSAGSGATIAATGSDQVLNQDVRLTATGAPNDTVGLFFFGASTLQVPFGQGFRCVGAGRVHRIAPFAVTGPANGSPAGEASLSLDFNAPYAAAITVGNVYFQYWYQDTVGPNMTFNLTDGLDILFQ